MENFCNVHSGITESIDNLKKSDEDQWTHITKIESALPKLVPIWVTIVLMVMSGVTASALTFAGMVMKSAGKL